MLFASSLPLFELAGSAAAPAPALWLDRDSARRLGVRARLRHPAGRKPFRRALAGRLRPGRPPGGGLRRGAILHYVRSTQRGTLDHVDRIGFYERQNCLVLDAVTVRNLELVEPLFAGAGDAVTLFRAIDTRSRPWASACCAPGCCARRSTRAEINRAPGRGRGRRSRDTVEREELRRSLDGILDIERLLSRVTLETANPRDLLALAASLARLPGSARARWRGFQAERLRALHGIARRSGRPARAHRDAPSSRSRRSPSPMAA